MARMSIDDRFLRDPRVQHLADALGCNKYEARGRLLDVYAVAYDMVQAGREAVLRSKDIDIAAGLAGFAKHMIEQDLACATDGDFVYIRGAKENAGYLTNKSEAGRKGGIKSGESRRNQSAKQTKQNRSSASRSSEAKSNPTPKASASPSADPPDPVKAVDRSSPPAAVDVRPVTDAFQAYFVATHEGAKPTWDATGIAMVKTLVGKTSVAEVVRRVGILQTAPPPFPQQPWDLRTFVANFDKCAAPTRANGNTNHSRDGFSHVLAVARGEKP